MCGIVGLFLKNSTLEPRFGELLAEMLVVMTGRGPDSAGFAVYGSGENGRIKLTVRGDDLDSIVADLGGDISGFIRVPLDPLRVIKVVYTGRRQQWTNIGTF